MAAAALTPQMLLAHTDSGALWPAEAEAPAALDAAYQLSLAVRRLRIARGEKPQGYKIGFTNRTIWERYRVFAPIWGPVWDTTVRHCDGCGTLDLARLCQPRLEPEIVFGMRGTPPADPSLEQLFDCVEWLAPGFEIVQSHRPDWRFAASETVADGALHGRLLVGARTPVHRLAPSGAALGAMLAGLHVQLQRDGALIEVGHGAHVLDGPLHALRHFVREMQRCPGAGELLAGDVVTTGTWTDAMPLTPGPIWRAVFDAPIPTLEAAIG
jgi:2-keto-4-pentenoate hydratase